MKISPKIYAEILFEMTHGKSNAQVVDFVKKMVNILAKNHDLSQEKRVVDFFKQIWNKKTETVEATILSARKVDAKSLSHIEKHIQGEIKAKKVVVTEKVDKNILGGFVLEYNNRITDNSLRTKINNLKRAMIK